jgi:hypothetical protein
MQIFCQPSAAPLFSPNSAIEFARGAASGAGFRDGKGKGGGVDRTASG